MRILITGIHGFVGHNLVKTLSPHHTIYGLATTTEPIASVQAMYTWEQFAQLPEVDAIIHLTGIAHDIDGKINKQLYTEVNVKLTQRIFNYFCTSSAHTFIHFSTVAAVANQVQDTLTEDVQPHPVGIYGETKWEAEQYISAHTPSHKQVYILRPSMIYGERCKGNLNLLYKLVSSGIPYPLGAFDNERTFASIENVAFVIHRLLQSNIPGGIYNVCDDQSISTNTLVTIIAQAIGKKPRIWHISRQFITMLAHMGTQFHLPLNNIRLAKLTQNFRVSNHKIKQALGIEHMPLSARDALTQTIQRLHTLKSPK